MHNRLRVTESPFILLGIFRKIMHYPISFSLLVQDDISHEIFSQVELHSLQSIYL